MPSPQVFFRTAYKFFTEKTKCLLPVHYTGYMTDMIKLNVIAKKYNLPVVEDACQSILGSIDNINAGQWGDKQARIISLRLNPLQLRIADVIARGPEEEPPPGLTEEATLEEGKILIKPLINPIFKQNNLY